MRYQANRSSKSARITRGFAAASAALFTIVLLAVLAAPALAVETHAFTGVTIGPGGKAASGQFTELASVTVDPSSGDLYVLDTANAGRLYKFDSEGEPLDFSATGTNFIEGTGGTAFRRENQIAIAPPGAAGGTAGDIYLANTKVVKIYSSAGLGIGQITSEDSLGRSIGLCGVAVDTAGNIFTKTNDAGYPDIVRKYTPTANPPANADESGSSISIANTCNLAVDGNGSIYASGEGFPRLYKLSSLTAEAAQLVDSSSHTVAVESGTNNFYGSGEDEITQYAEDGSVVAEFGEGRLAEATGVGVAGAGSDVYVVNRRFRSEPNAWEGRVDVYGPLTTLPKALAGKAEAITKTSATLHGTIDADGGPEASCEFEYVPEAAFKRQNETQQLSIAAKGGTFALSFVDPGGGTPQTTTPIAFDADAPTVQKALEALPNIGAGNVDVTNGPFTYRVTFADALAVKDLEQITVDVSNLTETEGAGAEMRTVADGHRGGFEEASKAPCAPAGPFSGNTAEAVSAELSGLTVGTKYRYRLVGENENGRLGSDENGSEPKGAPSFETLPVVTVHTGKASELTATSARLNATIAPEGVALTECFFEYGKFEANEPNHYSSKAPCVDPDAGEVGIGDEPVPVHADIGGLTTNTGYHFRIVANTALGPAFGADVKFETIGKPRILSQEVSEISESGATVLGSIHPGGVSTTYFVEYLTKAAFDESGFATAIKLPEAGEVIGSGQEAVAVSQKLSGLAPGITYVFRITATNDEGTVSETEASFRTYPPSSAGLPDGRAYEEVTPATPQEKNASNLFGNELDVLYASPDGDATTYYSIGGAGDTESSVEYPIYVGRRGANGWSSAGINPPSSTGTIAAILAYTEDLSGAYVEAGNGGAPNGIYLHELNGDLMTIASGFPEPELDPGAFPTTIDSEAGNLMLFESFAKLTPDAVEDVPNLYLWDKSSGEITLAGVLPNGTTPTAGAFAGPWNWLGGDPTVRSKFYTKDTLTRDGSKVFFTTLDTKQIYMRENPASPSAKTVQISASQKTNGSGPGGTDPNGPQPATYLGATPSGSFVFFKSSEELTDGANTGAKDEWEDLYRYDTASGELEDLTPAKKASGAARVLGLGGTSADGTYAYFVAEGALAKGAEAGHQNVYVWHEGRIEFITRVSSQLGDEIWVNTRYSGSLKGQKALRVTPDGRTIAFLSEFEYPEFKTKGQREIYRWEYEGDGLQCLSCSPTGQPAQKGAALQHVIEYALSPSPHQAVATRNLSPDGKRMFFSTEEALVNGDVNGVEDVYEWEANGKGSCTSEEQNGGCLFLISTGTSPEPSYFSDASESGDDVFFFTTQQLVGQDRDELSDVYDARVDGGLASQNPVSVRPCEGEGCLGAGTSAAEAQQRGTSTFAGPGNEKQKAKKKKSKKKKRHSKKSHHKKHGRNGGRNR